MRDIEQEQILFCMGKYLKGETITKVGRAVKLEGQK